MAGKWFLLFTCIFGASMGCICLERPQLERLERQDWAYTVLVSRVFHGIHKVGIGQVDAYEVYIQGIQKRSIYMGRDFIGVKTLIYTPDICKANLSTGKIYTVGGNVINRQLKSFTVCDKPVLLSTNEHPGINFKPCSAIGCSIWNNGYNDYHCDMRQNFIKKVPGVPSEDNEPYCKSTKFEYARNKCFKGCKRFFDGCNVCTCKSNGKFEACTKKFCFPGSLQEPRCIEPEGCPLQFCPHGKKCKLVRSKHNPCGKLVVVWDQTYKCDPLSEWNEWERKNCLKKADNYDELGCLWQQCCKLSPPGFQGWRKRKYCNKSAFCLKCKYA